MIESLKPGATAPTDRTSAPRGAEARTESVRVSRTERATPSAVAMLASQGVPVDMKLVNAVRAAIAEGRYAVDPAKIAEAMLASDLPRSA